MSACSTRHHIAVEVAALAPADRAANTGAHARAVDARRGAGRTRGVASPAVREAPRDIDALAAAGPLARANAHALATATSLRVAAPPLAEADWLRLTLPGVAGVDRTFEWDSELLAHDLP